FIAARPARRVVADARVVRDELIRVRVEVAAPAELLVAARGDDLDAVRIDVLAVEPIEWADALLLRRQARPLGTPAAVRLVARDHAGIDAERVVVVPGLRREHDVRRPV